MFRPELQALLIEYPLKNHIRTDEDLYAFTEKLRKKFLPQSPQLTRVTYRRPPYGGVSGLSVVLGAYVHSTSEIMIDPLLKTAPFNFLRVIVLHELAHHAPTPNGERGHGNYFNELFKRMVPNSRKLMSDVQRYLTLLGLLVPPAPSKVT